MEAKRNGNRVSHLRSSQANTKKTFITRFLVACAILILLITCASVWLAVKASTIKSELESATSLVPALENAITANDPAMATASVKSMSAHTSAARVAGNDPVWKAARTLPFVGENFEAVSEIATAADDVTRLGASPLVEAFQALDWKSLVPNSGGVKWEGLDKQLSKVTSAAYAVKTSEERLRNIESDALLPEIALPLRQAVTQLAALSEGLDAAADAATLAPAMLGKGESRTYLLMVQNNAEARSSGGIPGALAELIVDAGKLSLGEQRAASELGIMSPPLQLEPEQFQLYTSRTGKFMQDVNLTPDFPTAASTAQWMWERETGKLVDGVISVDPVALGYILRATGPVQLSIPELPTAASSGLPTELTHDNVVKTLLSDVYSKIPEPAFQDAYFTSVAKKVFGALLDGQSNAKALIEGLARGTEEHRVLLWSASVAEQQVIERHPLSGSISGPSVFPAQFGVYFNDGTGAKMDYYVKRTVQLVKECPEGGYEETTVRITSTNMAPADAGQTLPAYVTGGGAFGVPPGSVQTNIVAYGPVQAQVETAKLDGQKTGFAPHIHGNRPVGVLAVRLAPGESRTVEFTFGKIVQHAEPNVVVTPTVEDVKDVTLPTEIKTCG